jgi:hypothetical protein
MKKLVVYLCKGCQEQYLEEFGEGMGYTVPVKVVIVNNIKECDNYCRVDGSLNLEHREQEWVEE